MNPQAEDTSPIYFWRETHPETGYLSQWFNDPFHDPNEPSKIYKTAEHYMMHHKALLFNDAAVSAQVLRAGHPWAVKALGRKVHNFSEAVWAAERERIVEEGNYAKFTCAVASSLSEVGLGAGGSTTTTTTTTTAPATTGTMTLLGRLLATGNRELVEASPYDRIWGVGFTEAHAGPRRAEWGLNLLGKALMAVRERLRREDRERAEAEAEAESESESEKASK